MARRHTPYYHKLVALGAELVDRIGYDAALRFTTTQAEHLATRERVGVYDVYHQGALDLKGPDAEALLSRLLVNDPARLDDGGVLYSSLCDEAGGMVDDLTVYRLAGDHFWLCPTPSRVDTVDAWIRDHIDGRRAYLTNIVSGTAFLSLQGPRSRETLGAMTDLDLSTAALPYFRSTRGDVAEVPTLVARTGYSGELGYELFFPREYAEHMWDAAFAAGEPYGIAPCGLGALRSVRMEKKYPLYGLDLDGSTSPLEASLAWTVRFDKGDFIGREALLRQRDAGPTRRLVGIELGPDDPLPKVGDEVHADGAPVGSITSSDTGHFLGRTLAMSYVRPATAVDGANVVVGDSETGAATAGTVRLRAFYDPDRLRVRA
jgi:aminomethyltransferase